MKLPVTVRRRALGALVGATLALVLGVAMAASPAQAAEGTVLGAGQANAVAGSYIVVLKDAAMPAQGVGASGDRPRRALRRHGRRDVHAPRCAASPRG